MPILLFYLVVLFLSESVILVRCDEVQILLELKKSLGVSDESWTPNNAPCQFAGVTCTTKSVSAIDLTNKSLPGYLSFDTICQLSSLQKLSLGYNDLSGPIRPSLNNCTKLQHLDLAFNYLIGHIPDFSSLTELRVLNLSDNAFTGPVPWTSLFQKTKLTDFLIGDNPSLDRSLFPEELTSLHRLTTLYLSNCSLHGPIPPSIGNLTKLIVLELSVNSLTGPIPQEITRLTKLFQLELWKNQLTGTIPPNFRKLTELANLDFSSNNMGGDLTELKYLTKLQSLQLFYNQFSGEVPVEYGDFDNLVDLSIYNNMFYGQHPQNLGSKSDFDAIDVSTNSFTGPIPPNMCWLGKMTYMALLENQFTGEIPASYASCTTLKRFRVSNNSPTFALETTPRWTQMLDPSLFPEEVTSLRESIICIITGIKMKNNKFQ
ncbi:putative LRR receptor-like serine/threonine-protein kinase RLK [Acorus calamus]|uniref:LRR receptor-like serine/threonine-protein kinase RLK n=1 Tax=Acorus calamus TaxID=4465 RepID=A0AAV9E058_ACOCL|nr:putative LRR receptor-like serine/threonine-protein kinase RLK [Acorus calamus]